MLPGVEFFHHHHLNRCATRLEEGRDALPFAHYLLARFVDNHNILAMILMLIIRPIPGHECIFAVARCSG